MSYDCQTNTMDQKLPLEFHLMLLIIDREEKADMNVKYIKLFLMLGYVAYKYPGVWKLTQIGRQYLREYSYDD